MLMGAGNAAEYPIDDNTFDMEVSGGARYMVIRDVLILYFYGSYGRPISILDHPWINKNHKKVSIDCHVLLMPGGGEYGPKWHEQGINNKYEKQQSWLKIAIEYILSMKQKNEKLILETNSAGAVAAISCYRGKNNIDGMILNSPFLHLPSVLSNKKPELLDKQDQNEWLDLKNDNNCLSLIDQNNHFSPILIFSGKYDTITPREKIEKWIKENQHSHSKIIKMHNIPSGGHGFNTKDHHVAEKEKLDFIEGILSQ